ncbi:MAG TPA: oligosaccharide flippase family protein [Tepidisphaeraceae bacterium]|nr:oligosaccharide flippase family protein [Tepidisphaeraceae bacterium]
MSEAEGAPTPTLKRITAPPLGDRAGRGMIYTAMSLVLSRPASIIVFIASARLLTNEQLGMVALAYSWSSIGSMITKPGFDDVLVQRTRKMKLWVNSAFWFGLLFALLGMAVILGTGIVGSFTRNDPNFAWMLFFIALAAGADALAVIPGAFFRVNLRFAASSLISLAVVWSSAILIIIALLIGLGVYSQPVAMLVVITGSMLYFWRAYPVRLRATLQLRRWKYLWSLTYQRLITRAMMMLGFNGDYLALSLLQVSTAAIGSYYLAFQIMVQAQRLAGQGLASVLMPAMSHLDIEPERQRSALIRATRLLAVFSLPIGMGIAAASGPMIRTAFSTRYTAAIWPTFILGIGGIGLMQIVTLQSFAAAQRRYRDETRASFGFAIGIFIWVIPFAWFWGINGAAIGVMGHYLTYPIYCTNLLARGRMSIDQFYRALIRPAFAAFVALAPLWIVERLIPDTRWGDVGALAMFILISPPIYVMVMWLIDRHRTVEVMARLRAVIPGRSRKEPPSSDNEPPNFDAIPPAR